LLLPGVLERAARKAQDRIASASVGLVAAMKGSSSLFTIRTASEAPQRLT
jgi:hypothetical protein